MVRSCSRGQEIHKYRNFMTCSMNHSSSPRAPKRFHSVRCRHLSVSFVAQRLSLEAEPALQLNRKLVYPTTTKLHTACHSHTLHVFLAS